MTCKVILRSLLLTLGARALPIRESSTWKILPFASCSVPMHITIDLDRRSCLHEQYQGLVAYYC
ncbi:hypothetical protein M758_UG303900 [Ceratodon purpureus]|nr:hypothetical protein M758_UG303900 [Ceratodon purpureus]